jgi:hypothetical protein
MSVLLAPIRNLPVGTLAVTRAEQVFQKFKRLARRLGRRPWSRSAVADRSGGRRRLVLGRSGVCCLWLTGCLARRCYLAGLRGAGNPKALMWHRERCSPVIPSRRRARPTPFRLGSNGFSGVSPDAPTAAKPAATCARCLHRGGQRLGNRSGCRQARWRESARAGSHQ